MEMHNLVNEVKTNAIGAVVGGALGFYVAKKYGKFEHKGMLALGALVGVAVGTVAQAKFFPKVALPTIK